MPRWFPQNPKFHSAEESVVYQLLNQQMDGDWLICHSHEMLTNNLRIERGEADFLLFHPKKGLFLLEVKGGEVTYSSETGWLGKNKKGQIYSMKPMHQATSNLKKILHHLRHELRLPESSFIPHAEGVVFPSCHFEGQLPAGASLNGQDPDPVNTIIWDDRALDRLDELIGIWLSRFAQSKNKKIEANLSKAVEKFFFRSTLHVSISEKFEVLRENLALDQATERQIQVFSFLTQWPRFLVKGVSGSGKTRLAMSLALQHIAKGKRVLLLTYNRFLASWIRHHLSYSNENVFSDDPLVVIHYHELCHQVSERAGLKFESAQADQMEDFWENTSAELLMEGIGITGLAFDSIFVDEGQDIRSNWWISIEMLLRAGPKGSLGIFHDPAQNIYETLMDFPFNEPEIELNANCRNAGKISQLLKSTYGENYLPCEDQGGFVEETVVSDENLAEYLNLKISDSLARGLKPKQIVILGRHTLKNSPLAHLSNINGIHLVENPEERSKGILYSTYKAFKGLEADIVFLTEVIKPCEKFSASVLANGIGRARQRLYILKSK
jgi:hypothetical protein